MSVCSLVKESLSSALHFTNKKAVFCNKCCCLRRSKHKTSEHYKNNKRLQMIKNFVLLTTDIPFVTLAFEVLRLEP